MAMTYPFGHHADNPPESMSQADPKSIEIVIADKSPIVQGGLGRMFEDDERFTLVATASDGERFMEAVERLRFSIGIIGWDMPYMDGRAVLQAVRERPNPPRLIVYTGNGSPEIPRQTMQLGGAGFCSKREPPSRLVETVIAVSEGRMVFPFMDMSRPGGDPYATLTTREQELLEPIARCANLVLDTSQMTVYELRDAIKQQLLGTSTGTMSILIQSFGFKRGVPADADLVFDVRMLPNPHWVKELRIKTGLDDEVFASDGPHRA